MVSTSSKIRNNYVQPITNSNSEASAINYDLADLEEQNHEDEVEFSKDMLLQDVSLATRRMFKSIKLLENSKNTKRFLKAWFAMVFVAITGIGQLISFTYTPGAEVTSGNSTHYTKNVIKMNRINIGFASNAFNFIVHLPMQIWILLKYFDDNGEDFYKNIWKPLAKKEKEKLSKLVYKTDILLKVFSIVMCGVSIIPTMVFAAINEIGAPLWSVIYLEIVYAAAIITWFFGAFRYAPIMIFVVLAISSAAEYNIQKISTLIVRRIRSYDINKDGETKLLNELENHFNIAKEKIKKGVEVVGTGLALSIFTFILSAICHCTDVVLLAISGAQIDLQSSVYYFMAIPLFIYFVALLLRFTIQPSIQYELLIDTLHKPKHLWVISKCYSGNQATLHFFFNGLERQSKQLIWKSMGVPITFDVYQRVIGSLVSILIMTMAFMLRGAIAGD